MLLNSKSTGCRSPTRISVDEDDAVLCTILNIVYAMPPNAYCSSFEDLCAAVRALKKYGLPQHEILSPHTPCSDRLLAYAPLRAIELYALAAELDAEGLAASASCYLLSYHIPSLSDDLAIQMGARYLIRLHNLQSKRKAELRRLLFKPPDFHLPTRSCGLLEQRKLHRAWAMSVARIAWQISAGELCIILSPGKRLIPRRCIYYYSPTIYSRCRPALCSVSSRA